MKLNRLLKQATGSYLIWNLENKWRDTAWHALIMIYVLNRKKIHDFGRVAIQTRKRMMIVSDPLRTISSACWCFRFRSMANSMLCFTRFPSHRLYKALLVKILYLSCKTPCLNIPMVELSCCRLLLKLFSFSISAYWIVAMHTYSFVEMRHNNLYFIIIWSLRWYFFLNQSTTFVKILVISSRNVLLFKFCLKCHQILNSCLFDHLSRAIWLSFNWAKHEYIIWSQV